MRKVIDLKNIKRNGVTFMKLAEDNVDTNKPLLKIILFFTSRSKNVIYKTKLNKLLFYAQFLYYKRYQKKLIPQNFIKDYYGPVVENLDLSLKELQKATFLNVAQTRFGEVIKSHIMLGDNNFENEELQVLHEVLKEFDHYTSREISNYSHEEPLWIKANYKEVIKVEEAYLLNEF